MPLHRRYALAFTMLIALQVVTSFGAIGLLGRMSPAIEEILNENVASNEAAEEMLSALALGAGETGGNRVFADALERARRNVTEEQEVPVLDRIERYGNAALAGDTTAFEPAVIALGELIRINRAAMWKANATAKRLGRAGAWSAVVLALAAFGTGVLIVRHAQMRIFAPLARLTAVLQAWRNGDVHRRCHAATAADEMQRVLESVNALLDQVAPGEDLDPGAAATGAPRGV